MSTQDDKEMKHFSELLLETRQQNAKIKLDTYFNKWKKSDATKTTIIERAIGIIGLPILLFWGLLVFFIGTGMAIAMFLLRLVGSFFNAPVKKF
ncbi:MAG: hypothetical protein R3B45_03350 [Bdellovibrionota bacterium]